MNFSQISNKDLYQMCLRGEESAWEYVYNYVLMISRSPRWRLRDTPEDMAQSIVCHLLKKGIDQVRDQNAFRSFIKTVAVNFILDSFKKNYVKAGSLDSSDYNEGRSDFDVKSGNPGPEDLALEKELNRVLHQAIYSLSKKCQPILEAYIEYKKGRYKSYKVLAEKFGKTIGTLSSQIKRCLDLLRLNDEIRLWLEG